MFDDSMTWDEDDLSISHEKQFGTGGSSLCPCCLWSKSLFDKILLQSAQTSTAQVTLR